MKEQNSRAPSVVKWKKNHQTFWERSCLIVPILSACKKIFFCCCSLSEIIGAVAAFGFGGKIWEILRTILGNPAHPEILIRMTTGPYNRENRKQWNFKFLNTFKSWWWNRLQHFTLDFESWILFTTRNRKLKNLELLTTTFKVSKAESTQRETGPEWCQGFDGHILEKASCSGQETRSDKCVCAKIGKHVFPAAHVSFGGTWRAQLALMMISEVMRIMIITSMIKPIVMTMIMGRDVSHVSSVGACRPIGLESVVGLEATVVLGGPWATVDLLSRHLSTLTHFLDFGPSDHRLLCKQ